MIDGAFPYVRDVSVRFHDVDAMGHVHHSLMLVYCEEVRAAFWREVAGREGLAGIDYVLANVTVNFVLPIYFPDTLSVGLRVSRIGKSSFAMQYEIRNSAGAVAATAESVQVMYDYASRASKTVPDDVRTALESFRTRD